MVTVPNVFSQPSQREAPQQMPGTLVEVPSSLHPIQQASLLEYGHMADKVFPNHSGEQNVRASQGAEISEVLPRTEEGWLGLWPSQDACLEFELGLAIENN